MAGCAMLGQTLLPDMEKRGYKYQITLGPIMGCGTLAAMIPPSALGVYWRVSHKSQWETSLAKMGKPSKASKRLFIIFLSILMLGIILLIPLSASYAQELINSRNLNNPNSDDNNSVLKQTILLTDTLTATPTVTLTAYFFRSVIGTLPPSWVNCPASSVPSLLRVPWKLAWAIFMPLVNTAVFTVIFARVAHIETPVPYPIFAYCGFVVWNFFASSLRFPSSL
jgi:uncharacterized membrane protein (DUF485 family)